MTAFDKFALRFVFVVVLLDIGYRAIVFYQRVQEAKQHMSIEEIKKQNDAIVNGR